MKLLVILFFFQMQFSLVGQSTNVEFFQPDDIVKISENESNNFHVFSFWASWCAPCMKEMNLLQSFASECDCNLTLHFVNIEEEERREKALKKAFKKKVIEQLLFVRAPNKEFYLQVDPSWEGALPAMVLYDPKTKKRKFFNRLVTRKHLKEWVAELSTN